MTIEKISQGRRVFLKAGAASVAPLPMVALWEPVAAHSNAAFKQDHSQEYIFSGTCRGNCAGSCFLNVHVRGEKVVRTSARDFPDESYNRICIKGLTHVYRIYHPERLKYPMRRAGKRGEGKWERISWEEAIDTISKKWKGYQEQFGRASVSVYTGSGNYGICSGDAPFCGKDRFRNILGMTSITAAVDMARGQGTAPIIGMGALCTGNELADLANAKTIFVWGANPVNSQQQTTHFMLEAQERGAKLVVIDPVFSATASKADVFVPIRPGTDAALAMAMMNIIMRESWVDWNFILNHSVAPFLVKESTSKFLRRSDINSDIAPGSAEDVPLLRSAWGTLGTEQEIENPVYEGRFEINGHRVTCAYTLLQEAIAPYTVERVAELCDISVSQIEELAKLYATNKPSTIYSFYGFDHWVNGHYGFSATTTLAVLTGNIGKRGSLYRDE